MVQRVVALTGGFVLLGLLSGCEGRCSNLSGSGCESRKCGFDGVYCLIDCADPPAVLVGYYRGSIQPQLMWTGESSADLVATVGLDANGAGASLIFWDSIDQSLLTENEQDCTFEHGPPFAAGQRLVGSCLFASQEGGAFVARFCCKPVEMEYCEKFPW